MAGWRRQKSMSLALAVTLLIVAPAVAQGPPPSPTSATTIPEMRAVFPHDASQSVAAWTGSEAYIFGGNATNAQGTHIFRYDPVADKVTQMTAQLPVPTAMPGAFWDGTYVYVMGGYTLKTYSCMSLIEYVLYLVGLGPPPATYTCSYIACVDTVHQYDPATDTLTTLSLRMPAPGCGDVAWDGTVARFFPSQVPPNFYGAIFTGMATSAALGAGPGGFVFEFDPAAGKMQLTTARMLSSWGAAAETQNGTYYFGGVPLAPSPGLPGGVPTPAGLNASAIYRYDPANQTLLPINATLPTDWWGSRAIYDGSLVYLMGGFGSGTSARTDILTFDPVNQTTGTYSLALPHASAWMSTAATGTDGFAFGGDVPSNLAIYCLHCPPEPPVIPPPPPPPVTPPPTVPPPTPTPPPNQTTPPPQWGSGENKPWTETTTDFEPDWTQDNPPEAAVFVMRQPCGDWAVTFDGSASSDLDGAVTGWTWEFDDGTGNVGRGAQRTFAGPGSYRVELTVTDDAGNMAKKVVELLLVECPAEEPWVEKSLGEEGDGADEPGTDIVGAIPRPDDEVDPEGAPDAVQGTPSLHSADGRLEVLRAPLWALMAMALGVLLLMLLAYRRRRKAGQDE